MAAIVINAFNRPLSLARLLEGLAQAEVPEGVPLLISIDGGGDPEVAELARAFAWPHGSKIVRPQPANLGLVGHFLFCGGLTRELGDIVYLEDDLVVSRQFYRYAIPALEAFRADRRIAGISLNRLANNGYTKLPFQPVLDSGDAFFAQVYWYQGQAYTPRMWADFEDWWRGARRSVETADGLHPLFLPHPRWQNDFFPEAMKYLHTTGRFFAFPRESHTTNYGDPGVHFSGSTGFFQVPLQQHPRSYSFQSIEEATAVYDTFFEILPEKLAAALPGADFDVDLNGTKPPEALRRTRVLTGRPVHRPEATFGLVERPAEMNVLDAVPGHGISLAWPEQVRRSALANLQTEARLQRLYQPQAHSIRRLVVRRIAARFDR